MSEEILEHNLAQLHGKEVVIILPGHGKQSFSWPGTMGCNTNVHPVKFNVSGLISSIFEVTDVKSVEVFPQPTPERLVAVVRLKGPQDYNVRLSEVVA